MTFGYQEKSAGGGGRVVGGVWVVWGKVHCLCGSLATQLSLDFFLFCEFALIIKKNIIGLYFS